MESQKKILLAFFSLIIISFILAGMAADGITESFKGFILLQIHPARLLSDFFQIQGIGATLINSAIVGLIGLLLVLINKTPLSGPTFAAIFTLMGFGLFGKTPLNVIPIFLGVFISGRLVGKKFSDYILIALFGSALGPLVSTLAFELGVSYPASLSLGIVGGIVTGMFLPAIAMAMLHFHQGYNLYNLGLSCGFFSLFAASLIRISGHEFQVAFEWYTVDSLLLKLLVPGLSILLLVFGIAADRKKALKSLMAIQKRPGRLPSDFMTMESMPGALVNSGLIGLIGSLYVWIIGADFNGPVIGGLLTVIGFSTFGTHLKNAWPIVLGVITSTLVFGKPLTAPGPILAALFGTTLSPLAGQFGIVIGFIAGFLHFIMVSFTGTWQGGMNLYNNGFAGGLTATFIVAIIQWYRSNKSDFP